MKIHKLSMSLLFVLSFSAISAEIHIDTFPIPLMVESSTKGKFIDLGNEIAKRSGVKFIYEVAPPRKIVSDFSKKKVDCFSQHLM